MSQEQALGLRRGETVVVPYDARWSSLFADSARELVAALGSSILAVHHVGSTSVPGLCAKPILDILVSVPDLRAAALLVPRLETLGYEFRPDEEVPDRHFFRRPHGGALRTHHLSLAEPSSRHHALTLAFRDALRSDAQLADEYARLKSDLAREFPRDRSSYIERKSDFVERVLAGLGMK